MTSCTRWCRLTAASSNLRASLQDSRRPSAVTPHEKLLIAASNGVGIGAPMPFQKEMILSCSLQLAPRADAIVIFCLRIK